MGVDPWEMGEPLSVPGVEVPELRGEFARTVSTEHHGVYRTEVSQERLHYRAGERWLPIDATLGLVDGSYRGGANSFDLTLAAAADGLLARFGLGAGLSVGWSLEGAVAAPAVPVGDHELVYGDVLSGVDLRFTSTPSGVKESLVNRPGFVGGSRPWKRGWRASSTGHRDSGIVEVCRG